MTTERELFWLGWEEWVSLPNLGLPAIKAKVDTGARTSALHAFLIEPFGPSSAPMVRFGVHPVPGRDDIEVFCSSPVIDTREVTSSNGEKETRLVVASEVKVGDRIWPIEITLTNRESMAYRMLLGRQAIRDDMFVDPTSSFRQPRLSYRLYQDWPKADLAPRCLRLAVVTNRDDAASNRRLMEAARSRGHVLEILKAESLQLAFDGLSPKLLSPEGELGHYDVVVPRLKTGLGAHGAAIIRQFELMGSFSLNAADAIDRLRNALATTQALIAAGIPTRAGGGQASPRPNVLVLVVGTKAIASARVVNDSWQDAQGPNANAERALAVRAARALRLGLVQVEIASGTEPYVVGMKASPELSAFHKATRVRYGDAILSHIEVAARGSGTRSMPELG